MQNPRFQAIRLVVDLVNTTGMALWDACRCAAFQHQVDCDWLYRELTEK